MNEHTILVIEDDALIAANLVHTLSSLGYTVQKPVATGEDAVRSVTTQQPDLVLTDIELIGSMNGIEAAEKIRAIADIPIVYLTAYTDDLRLKQAQLTEPYGYIVKPAHSRELNATIEMALYKHGLDRKLKESEEKYRVVADFTYDWEFWLAPDGKFIYVSPSCERITGYRPEEFMVDPDLMVTIVHDNDRDRVIDNLSHKEDGFGEKGALEFRIIARGGEERWISHECQPLYGPNGEYLGIRGSNRDITERKKAEEALRVSNAFLDSVIENIPVLVFLKDARELRFVRINRAVEELTGYFCSDLMGKNDYDFVPKEQADFFVGKDRQVLKRKEIVDIPEEPLQTRDKGMRTLQTWKVPLLDDKGEPEYLLGISVDITERKRAEEALRQANKKLTLLSGITRHDINNQLTVLRGYLTILEKKQSDPTLNDYFLKISTAAGRISAMIQFTREYECIGIKAPAWQDCRTLVDTAAKDSPLGQVTVKNDFPAGTEVFADPLVVKVFYNLMDNAVRYGGKITTIRFSVEEPGDVHLIVCEDDGNGVPAEEKEKIFERGFGKNTGLGLALSQEILSITGITIRETGEPGKGARFEMTVPKGAWR